MLYILPSTLEPQAWLVDSRCLVTQRTILSPIRFCSWKEIGLKQPWLYCSISGNWAVYLLYLGKHYFLKPGSCYTMYGIYKVNNEKIQDIFLTVQSLSLCLSLSLRDELACLLNLGLCNKVCHVCHWVTSLELTRMRIWKVFLRTYF